MAPPEAPQPCDQADPAYTRVRRLALVDSERDESSARERERAARERDLRAAVRDRAAGPDLPEGERRAREEAAADRRASAEDRRAAARERDGAGEAGPPRRPDLRIVRDDEPRVPRSNR
jgi:hypothetical protein